MNTIPNSAQVKCERCGATVRVSAETCLACANPDEINECPNCQQLRKELKDLTEVLAKALNSLEEHNREYHYTTPSEVITELRERFGITDIVRRLPGKYGLDKS